jgi:molybdopterin converting factor small subunit
MDSSRAGEQTGEFMRNQEVKIKLSFLLDVPELAGASIIDCELQAGTTVGGLRNRIKNDFPSLYDWIEFLLVSVEGSLVNDDYTLVAGQKVTLLLPRSGG